MITMMLCVIHLNVGQLPDPKIIPVDSVQQCEGIVRTIKAQKKIIGHFTRGSYFRVVDGSKILKEKTHFKSFK